MIKSIGPRARSLARARAEVSAAPAEPARAKVSTFTISDPEPVLTARGMTAGLECWDNGRWYEPPLPLGELARAMNASAHHGSAIMFKVNQVVRDFIPHPLLSRETFRGLCLDHIALGMHYVERVDNRLGKPMALKRSLAKYTRRGLKDGQFFFMRDHEHHWHGQEHEFAAGSVYQGMGPNLDQEIYGVPEYLCTLPSAFLNESATLFRAKYYRNGAHSGFILYLTDKGMKDEDVDAIEECLTNSKGIGNFSSMLLHVPDGKEKGVQILHPGEAAAKDEFFNIKNVSRDDVLAAHRVYPQLLGVVPQNAGGFGNVTEAQAVFFPNEIVPIQQQMTGLNDWLGQEVVRFRDPPAAA